MRFLGIDAGATFLKGAVLDGDNRRVERVIRTAFPPFLNGDLREVNCAEIVTAVEGLLDELYAAAPDARGLVLCGQMHGMVLTSGCGDALSNFISWQDSRAAQSFADLASRVDDGMRQETGNELRASLPVSTLFHMKQRGELPATPFLPASLPDYLAAHLCRTRAVTGATNAAAHGCMNVSRGTWHTGMLRTAGLDFIEFPQILPEGSCVGTLAGRWGSMPCYLPVGDQQAALLGTSLEPGELSLNVATGSQVSLLSKDPKAGAYQVRPYFGGCFLHTITHIPAGRALNLLVGLLSTEASWEMLERAARDVPVSSLRVDLSFFAGAMGESGAITNIREDNFTPGHIFKAAIETMAVNYERCALRLSPAREWCRLVFSGGLILKLKLLREEVLRQFGIPFRIAEEAEDTLQGLAYLAAEAAR